MMGGTGVRPARFIGLFFAIVILAGCTSYKGKVDGERYFSPNGEFSIALPASNYTPVAESVFSDQIFVDFMLAGSTTAYGVAGLQTLEWLILSGSPSSVEFAELAPSLAKQHVAQRFSKSGANFTFLSGTFFAKDGRSEYHFFASGEFRGRYTAWEGIIVHLGDRIAFVEYVTPIGALGYPDAIGGVRNSRVSQGLAKWAASLRRES